jgi:ABC-type nitrate/sulfonate/bicarbonate transport system ATPase subunit
MIVVDTVGKSFGAVNVLRDISFEVGTGEFATLFGPSGCGKTTTLRILAGLEAPDQGSVTVDGVDAASSPDRRGRLVSVVWQEPRLLAWRTAAQNVELGLELLELGLSRAEIRQRALESLDLVGLADSAKALPRYLSGGMRQRVNLARALAVDAEVVLMDEPLANLNEVTEKVRLMEQIVKISHVKRKTIVYVTHGLNEGIFMSDKIIVCSAKPTRVLDEVAITTPRPRDLNADEAKAIRDRVTRLLADQLI